MPFQTVLGTRVNYVHRRPVPTSWPPVVFVHGAGGTHQHWLYQVRDLAQAPTYALDLPGHGRSEGPGRDSIAAYSDWLIAFLDVVELEQAVLVGHSMGGGIALDMAVRHPDRLAGLGLIATGARLPVAPAILNGILENKDATVRLICRAAFGPEASEEMERLGRRQMGATPAKVLHGDFVSCDAFDVMDQLGRIETPSLVMCGTQDQLTPAKYAVYLRDGIVGARLTLVEGAGHMVMVEQPATVVRALTEFLERT